MQTEHARGEQQSHVCACGNVIWSSCNRLHWRVNEQIMPFDLCGCSCILPQDTTYQRVNETRYLSLHWSRLCRRRHRNVVEVNRRRRLPVCTAARSTAIGAQWLAGRRSRRRRERAIFVRLIFICWNIAPCHFQWRRSPWLVDHNFGNTVYWYLLRSVRLRMLPSKKENNCQCSWGSSWIECCHATRGCDATFVDSEIAWISIWAL